MVYLEQNIGGAVQSQLEEARPSFMQRLWTDWCNQNNPTFDWTLKFESGPCRIVTPSFPEFVGACLAPVTDKDSKYKRFHRIQINSLSRIALYFFLVCQGGVFEGALVLGDSAYLT